MEHIKSFDSFLNESAVTEGIMYNDSCDADMLAIGTALNEEPEKTDPKERERQNTRVVILFIYFLLIVRLKNLILCQNLLT